MFAASSFPLRKPIRWTVRRKIEVIDLINGGKLSYQEADEQYGLSKEEIDSMMRDVERFGGKYLKVKNIGIKRKNRGEEIHLSRIAALPCSVSGMRPVQVHHLRSGMGMGMKNSHFRTIPLHYDYHQGAKGFHTIGSKTWEAKNGSEERHWEKTMARLYGDDRRKWPHD